MSVRWPLRRKIWTDVNLTPEFFLLFVLVDLELSLLCEVRDFCRPFGVERVQRFRNNLVCVETLVEVMILVLYQETSQMVGVMGTDDATYLDRSYPSQALLSPIRAHPVLDLSQNIGDEEERQVLRRYVFQSFVWAEQ